MSKNSEKFIRELLDSGLEMDEAGLETLRENIASGNWYPNPGRKALAEQFDQLSDEQKEYLRKLLNT